MNLAYKYRIYPSRNQQKAIDYILSFNRFLYNSALQERRSHYSKFSKGTSYSQQCAALPEIKQLFSEETKNMHSQTLQQTLKKLDTSYKAAFRRIKAKDTAGFPRYKAAHRFRSFNFPQTDLTKGGVVLQLNNRLKVFGLPGEVKVVWHRPHLGVCKQVSFIKSANKYYIVLFCKDVPAAEKQNIDIGIAKVIGIDLGVYTYITDDAGNKIKHPRAFHTAKEKLADANRKLALKQRGSNNRKRALTVLQRTSERVANVRRDFHHKAAAKIIKENDIIIMEDLNISSMIKSTDSKESKKNILDAAMGAFAPLIAYKAERAGKLLIKVDPNNSSKECSGCGNIKEDLKLLDRIYECDCGLKLDRDHNAAIVIKRRGLRLAVEQQKKTAKLQKPSPYVCMVGE